MPVEEIVKTLVIILVIIGALVPVVTWMERKQSALMQDRIGANRADIAGITILGLFHPVADVIKLLTKEDVVPQGANRVLHLLAPLIAAIPAVIAYGVIPYGGVYTFGDHTISLVVADPDWGMLYIFAIASIATYGTVIAGWSSNNNWSLIGGIRASAQMVSYEVTMGLSLVGIFMVFQTLSLQDMALAQDRSFALFGLDWLRLPAWGVFFQPLAFILFLTCMMAENKRPPFDMPEGDSEIIAGYHLEYSGMRFGLFFMSEFIQVVVIAGLMTTVFLGGWSLPYLSTDDIIGGVGSVFGTGFATGLCLLLQFASFMLKVLIMIWFQLALRWTLPRFRYDQVMDLCWKIILPLSIANILVTGFVILLLHEGGP